MNKFENKLYILMVSNHFYPSQGGMERAAHRLATQLIKIGHTVEMLTPRFNGLSELEFIDDIKVSRFPILRSPHVRYDLTSKFIYTFSLIRQIFARRKKADILHVHQALFAAFVTVIAGFIIQKKVIVKVAGSGQNGNINIMNTQFFAGNFMLWVLKRADAFISLSPQITDELLKKGIARNKICEIPNGIYINDYTPSRAKEELRDDFGILINVFTCVFTGRLSPEKNISFLLIAWKSFCEKKNDALLLIAGDGPERKSLEKQVRELSLCKNVIFLGHISNIAEVLALSDCFVLSSISEGMSNSILEAMAVGTPCVVSDIPANSNLIVDQESGLLFDITSTNNLVSSLLKIASDERLATQLSENARKKIEEIYNIYAVAQKHTKLYTSLL